MTPDLEPLAHTWKDADMTTLTCQLTPSKLSHTARWEGRIGLAASAFLGGFAVLAAVSGVLADDLPRVGLAAFVGVLAVSVARGTWALRRSTRAADELLLGSPLDVARGHRAHLHARLCGIRSAFAVSVSLTPFPLTMGLMAYGAYPVALGGMTMLGYAVWLAALHLRTVPTLRADLARADVLIAELSEE